MAQFRRVTQVEAFDVEVAEVNLETKEVTDVWVADLEVTETYETLWQDEDGNLVRDESLVSALDQWYENFISGV